MICTNLFESFYSFCNCSKEKQCTDSAWCSKDFDCGGTGKCISHRYLHELLTDVAKRIHTPIFKMLPVLSRNYVYKRVKIFSKRYCGSM